MMDTVYKLSERNCVELVIKLIDTGRLQLIFTKNGREYMTHKQLSEEIEDEVLAHGGAYCFSVVFVNSPRSWFFRLVALLVVVASDFRIFH